MLGSQITLYPYSDYVNSIDLSGEKLVLTRDFPGLFVHLLERGRCLPSASRVLFGERLNMIGASGVR